MKIYFCWVQYVFWSSFLLIFWIKIQLFTELSFNSIVNHHRQDQTRSFRKQHWRISVSILLSLLQLELRFIFVFHSVVPILWYHIQYSWSENNAIPVSYWHDRSLLRVLRISVQVLRYYSSIHVFFIYSMICRNFSIFAICTLLRFSNCNRKTRWLIFWILCCIEW